MKHAIATTLLSAIAVSALAHQDMRLSLAEDGRLRELPAQYSVTRMEIEFSPEGAGRLRRLSFLSAGRKTVVKQCLLDLVPSGSLSRTSLAGSWYHEERYLPHYVYVLFRDLPEPASYAEEPGVQFLFSLRDGRLLEVTKIVPLIPGQYVQRQEVKLSNGCPI